MEQIFSQFTFPEILIFFLIGSLFFKELLTSWLTNMLGLKPAQTNTETDTTSRRIVDVQNMMTELKMHFNDETTHILTDMQVMLKVLSDNHTTFRESQLSQCSKLEEIRDSLRDMSRNGIRIRKE